MLRPLISTLFFLGMVYVNYLSNALPINGYTPAQLSAKYPNLFVPDGRTFSIWGIIYLFLTVFLVWLWRGAIRGEGNRLGKVQNLFLITCCLNVAWLLSWHYEYLWLSVGVMLVFLTTLLYTNEYIFRQKLTTLERWCVAISFGLYAGWISVATIANITAALVGSSWNGFGTSATIWAEVMILVASGLGLWMFFKRDNQAYLGVILWALWGILRQRQNYLDLYDEIRIVIYVCIGILIFIPAFVVINKKLVK